ncbi:MAG: GntR family transcriptional regulator [Rhodobacteraceae bacterium]|nr:GntR family transcriptional regulator [Paracoccaceae bacterium]
MESKLTAQAGRVRPPEGGKSRRVYLLLRDEIANGHYPVGSVLPSEDRLGKMYRVSRVTVRRALKSLTDDGLIEKRMGAGSTVIAARADAADLAADMATLIPQVADIGRQSSARLLSFSYGTPPDAVARDMRLDPGARVQTAVRVRVAEGTPFSHLTTHVPETIARNYSETDLATSPLFQLLERSGVKIASARQSVTATLASPDVAEALEVAVASPLLSLTRLVADDTGTAVEHLTALYRPDMFRLEMALHRVGGGDDRHWEPVIGTAERARAAE